MCALYSVTISISMRNFSSLIFLIFLLGNYYCIQQQQARKHNLIFHFAKKRVDSCDSTCIHTQTYFVNLIIQKTAMSMLTRLNKILTHRKFMCESRIILLEAFSIFTNAPKRHFACGTIINQSVI